MSSAARRFIGFIVAGIFHATMILFASVFNVLYEHQSIYSETDNQVCSFNTFEFPATLLSLPFMLVEVQLRM